jgi:hypothetical protein
MLEGVLDNGSRSVAKSPALVVWIDENLGVAKGCPRIAEPALKEEKQRKEMWWRRG